MTERRQRDGAGGRGGMPTMEDIARLAEVSKPTVSRALNDSPLVNAETRERVLAIARAHGYSVNRNAQKLRRERASTIAVVLDFQSHRHGAIGDPFIFELLAGISEALSVRNLDLLLSPSGLDTVEGFVEFHRSRAADGFILLGQGNRDSILQEAARRVPMVVWGAAGAGSSYCSIGSDNFLGGQLAGRRFLDKRRKDWLFVGNRQHAEIRLRYEGLCDAAAGHADIRIRDLSLESMAFSAVHARAAAYLRANAWPDAVFAFSDTAAMAVIGAFAEQRCLAPEHYSLVGYNNIPPAAHFTPPITTVAQETDLAGAILVEKLVQRLEGGRPTSVLLPTVLIDRQT